MELFWLLVGCFAYVLIGFFAEILVSGEEYRDSFGWLMLLWPVALAMYIFMMPFCGAYKLAMWIREKIKVKEK